MVKLDFQSIDHYRSKLCKIGKLYAFSKGCLLLYPIFILPKFKRNYFLILMLVLFSVPQVPMIIRLHKDKLKASNFDPFTRKTIHSNSIQPH